MTSTPLLPECAIICTENENNGNRNDNVTNVFKNPLQCVEFTKNYDSFL